MNLLDKKIVETLWPERRAKLGCVFVSAIFVLFFALFLVVIGASAYPTSVFGTIAP